MEIHLKTPLKTVILSRSKAKPRTPTLGILDISDVMFIMVENKIFDLYATFSFSLSELPQHPEAMVFHLWITGSNTLERQVNPNVVIDEQTGNRTLSQWKKEEIY